MDFPWSSLAIVTEVHISKEGVFVEVDVMPAGPDGVTCRWFSPYTGNKHGLWLPPEPEDEVVIVSPSGDPMEGAVAFAKAWSPSHVPPQRALDNKEDIVLTIKKDKSVWIEVAGQGKAYILCEDTGKIYLGDKDGTEPTTKATTLKSHLDGDKAWKDGHTHTFTGVVALAACSGTTNPPTAPSPNVPEIKHTRVEAK